MSKCVAAAAAVRCGVLERETVLLCHQPREQILHRRTDKTTFFSAKGINRQGMEWKCYVETAFSMSRPQAIYFCLDKYASVATWHICGMFQIVCTTIAGDRKNRSNGVISFLISDCICVSSSNFARTQKGSCGILWQLSNANRDTLLLHRFKKTAKKASVLKCIQYTQSCLWPLIAF